MNETGTTWRWRDRGDSAPNAPARGRPRAPAWMASVGRIGVAGRDGATEHGGVDDLRRVV
jgi:hypothetical protein